jgi:hypothetical protein
MAVPEVKKLAQALSQEYNKPNSDLAKCGQYLTQLKVRTTLRKAIAKQESLLFVAWSIGIRARSELTFLP